MSLKEPHLKMSKSHENPKSRILLTDDPDEVRQKINGALTDSEEGISYDRAQRPGVSNLLEILAHLDSAGDGPEQTAYRFRNLSKPELKAAVAEAISRSLEPIRAAYAEMMGKEDREAYLQGVAAEGAMAARSNAKGSLDRIYSAVGLK